MKRESGIRGISLLIALMLMGAVFVPVSADTRIITPDNSNIVKTTHNQHIDFPVEKPKDLQPAKPLPESEMYIVSIPESWLKEKNNSKDPELIDISVSKRNLTQRLFRITTDNS